MPKKLVIPTKLQPWIEARRKFNLSHAHIQMARELGFNPKKLGQLNNHNQEPWKLPLPDFIEVLYLKQYGKKRPDIVRRIEEMVAENRLKNVPKRHANSLNLNNPLPILSTAAIKTAAAQMLRLDIRQNKRDDR